MDAPKQRWTEEEESALKAGVRKHGPGKWRTILKDPEFSSVLCIRPNVDLKDKWRNMSVTANGSGSRDRGRLTLKRNKTTVKQDKNSLSVGAIVVLQDDIVDATPLAVSPGTLEISVPQKNDLSSKDSTDETIVSADRHENGEEPTALSNGVQEPLKEAKRKRKHISNSNKESQREIVTGRDHDECPLDNQVGSNPESKRKKKKIKLGMLETKSEVLGHCNTTSEQTDPSNLVIKDKKKTKNHTSVFEISDGNNNDVEPKKNQASLSHIVETDMKTEKETKSQKKKKGSKSTSQSFDSKIGENLDGSSSMNLNNENSSVSKNEDSSKPEVENSKGSISQNAANSKNDNFEKNINDSSKKAKSVQSKSISPFQRIRIDDVKFANEKLQDNSYWAKGGADSGYGAKAQEVLGQVRGRDFRHEKTKKKRGSYRGGQIDLQSHSIKFNYSDDE